ncbi:MAG: tripartite tricarboxylate transporter substrate binding protein [Burkholderiales bacterium]|nr:tripartite tricarboxylate transporter substrate binding protein [Burkholderiales bacterium]
MQSLLKFLLLLCAAASLPVLAQPYPNRPIRLIVPFPAGGAADLAARTITQAFSQQLGQSVVIDNRGGADGAIAGDAVRTAPADGYTLLFATTTGMNAAPVLRKQPPYDPITMFTPVTLIGRFGFFLFVHESLPARNVAEFLAHVRANPGKVAYGTGNGTSVLATAQLALVEKLNMLHVPYKGDAPATTDLIAGRVQVMIGTPGSAMPQVKEGRLRVLATLLSSRSPLAPDAPTVVEAGLGKLTISPWAGLFGPAKLPPEVVERLNAAMRAVAARADVREGLDRIAFQMQASTPAEMAAVLKEQLDLWRKTADEVGLERN